VRYWADDVVVGGQNKPGTLKGIMVNYGQTKSKKDRESTLARREKAWKTGKTPHGHGCHYRAGKKTDWIWDKSTLKDIRATQYKEHIENLHKTMEKVK